MNLIKQFKRESSKSLISKGLTKVANAIDLLARKRNEKRLAQHVARLADYSFSSDYVSSHEAIWNKYLEPFKGRENVRLLEIGCFEGRSSIWFLDNILQHPTSSITCVDSFYRPGGEICFDHNIKISGSSDKVIKIKGCSEEVLITLKKQSFDIVYIDGSHHAANVMMDAMASWLLLTPAGIVIFDDYRWRPDLRLAARPKLAIDIFLEAMNGKLSVLSKEYQVILKKNEDTFGRPTGGKAK